MSKFDIQYNELIRKIIKEGISDSDQNVRPKYADGTPSYSKAIISEKIVIEDDEVPILTTKYVAWKTAIHEMLWFYVKRTSDATYLDENNVKIWKEWTRSDNTIGTAYGYQLGKPIIEKIIQEESMYHNTSGELSSIIFPRAVYTNQVHNLINGLKNNPASRRHIITLINIDDVWDMALFPCVWHSQWLVKQGKLHVIIGIRSNDMALGNPFNVFQYYVLWRMIAQVVGLELGTLTFNVNDMHVYERHIPLLEKQIERHTFEAPTLWINPTVTNFDDFTIKDFILDGYKYDETPTRFEIAI